MDINVVASFLFFLEFYHTVVHLFVLMRIRLLPRKDVVRVWPYFLFDTLTVFSVYLYTRTFWWQDIMTLVQMLQHFYFIIFWERTIQAKKIVSWSSLDYQATAVRKQWPWVEILGTCFDVAVHWVNTFLLAHFINTVESVVSVAITFCMVYAIMFNPQLAWSTPMDIPSWINRRIKPIQPHLWVIGGVEQQTKTE